MKIQIISRRALAILLLMVSVLTSQALQENLSAADRKEFLKKLELLREAAENSSKNRFSMALRAYRNAITSDAAAHDLYLKCIEKANFTDEKKSSQDFRDWKRMHKEKQDTPEFRRALQHQLNWLLLSIEASVNPDDIQSLAIKALSKIDAIMDDYEVLKDHRGLLNQDVLSSVYAKAYDINGLEAKDWPLSPLKISEIYDKVVMPPLRNTTSVSRLRGAWKKRIEHEGLIRKNWGKVPSSSRVGMKKDVVSPEFLKWKANDYPELLWKKEMECYKAGDEKQSSTNMLGHLSEYMSHKQSLRWTKEFQDLMSGGVEVEIEEEGD